ncbi:hypothetical protein Tco_0413282 [Tanacetum coccineum]
MEEDFDPQMNNEVDQNSVEKQYLEADVSKVHDESKLISKLEREYLNLQLKYQNLQESFDNKKSQASQEAPDFRSLASNKNSQFHPQDNGSVFPSTKLCSEYYEGVGIYHQKSVTENSQQKGVVEDVIGTLWKQQVNDDISKLHVSSWAKLYLDALCYLWNDSENLGKFQAKADMEFSLGMPPRQEGLILASRPDLVSLIAENDNDILSLTAAYAEMRGFHAGCQDTRRSTSGSAQFLRD